MNAFLDSGTQMKVSASTTTYDTAHIGGVSLAEIFFQSPHSTDTWQTTSSDMTMTRLHGPATARWYDPSRGTYAAVAGSPIANTGTHAFAPPGPNGAGDGDWLLLLQAQ